MSNKTKFQNCQDYNQVKPFAINGFTRMMYDSCAGNKEFQQEIGPGNYRLSNYHSCVCRASNVENVSLSQPQVYYKDGVGWAGMDGCTVDADSKLRITDGNLLTHFKCKNQLWQRPYLTIPYMGRGSGNPCVETILKPGEDTSQQKPCNVLAGNERNNNFIPLIPCIKDNIQKPEHLIPDSALTGWVRGGLPSRQIVRNMDYMGKCGELYKNPGLVDHKYPVCPQ
jgi:hypothetical protein